MQHLVEQIVEQNAFVRSLINNAPVGIFVVQDGKFKLVSPGFQQITGFSDKELLDKNSLILVLPEYRAKVREDAIRQLRCEDYHPYEFPFTTKDGQIRWAIQTVTSTKYAGERAILGYFMDITPRKLAMEALRRHSDTLKTLLDATPESVLLLDLQGTILAGNEVAALRLELSIEELVGSCIFNFLSSEAAALKKAHLEEVLRSSKPLSFEYSQAGRYYDTRCHPILDTKGQVSGFAILSVDITEHKDSIRKIRTNQRKFKKALYGTVSALASALEKRDSYTAGHQKRVTQLSCAISQEMKLPKDRTEGLNVAATLHDIGKITTPAEILSKPTVLTEHEMALVRDHARASYDILKKVDFTWPVSQIILQHHERLDGSGYPSGCKGEEILLEARILAVADVVEAMASHRPYRPALGIEKALEEINRHKGILYDPDVVEACIRLFSQKDFKFTE